MSEAKTVTASFASIPQLTLGVSLGGDGQGTVTSYPNGISCPGACSSVFDEGSTIYLMAAPSPGTGFAGFSGGGCSGAATICVVPISAAESVTATFTGTAAGSARNATRAVGSLVIGSLKTVDSAAILTVKTQESGTFLTAGRGTVPVKRELSAGTSKVRVKLGPAARRHLRRHRSLRLRLLMGFVPSDGSAPDTHTVPLRFHAALAKAARR